MFIAITPRYGGNVAGNVLDLFVNVDNIRDVSIWADSNVETSHDRFVTTIHFMNGTKVEIDRAPTQDMARERLWEVFRTARQFPI